MTDLTYPELVKSNEELQKLNTSLEAENRHLKEVMMRLEHNQKVLQDNFDYLTKQAIHWNSPRREGKTTLINKLNDCVKRLKEGISAVNKIIDKPDIKARKEFLQTVQELTCKDRNASYGPPKESFDTIAALWNVYLNRKITDHPAIDKKEIRLNYLDVALLMDLMKSARLIENPSHYDSWLDKAGYSACGGGIIKESLQGN